MVKFYKASQELIDILLKYGFADNTAKLYPYHYQRLQLKGYDPYSMKRIFCVYPHSDYVMFHYLYIRIHHISTFNHIIEKQFFTGEELRSLIAFYKLPVQMAKEWLDAYSNALDLHKYYQKICALPEFFNSETDKKIKETYEAITLPG